MSRFANTPSSDGRGCPDDRGALGDLGETGIFSFDAMVMKVVSRYGLERDCERGVSIKARPQASLYYRFL